MRTMQTNEPLLYIQQPDMKKPKLNMQVDYHTRTEPAKVNRGNKRFKQYSIAEKIHYLLHFPKGMPQVKCEVITKDSVYRGWLIKENETHLWLKNFKRREEQIAIRDILDIHLISF